MEQNDNYISKTGVINWTRKNKTKGNSFKNIDARGMDIEHDTSSLQALSIYDFLFQMYQ